MLNRVGKIVKDYFNESVGEFTADCTFVIQDVATLSVEVVVITSLDRKSTERILVVGSKQECEEFKQHYDSIEFVIDDLETNGEFTCDICNILDYVNVGSHGDLSVKTELVGMYRLKGVSTSIKETICTLLSNLHPDDDKVFYFEFNKDEFDNDYIVKRIDTRYSIVTFNKYVRESVMAYLSRNNLQCTNSQLTQLLFVCEFVDNFYEYNFESYFQFIGNVKTGYIKKTSLFGG